MEIDLSRRGLKKIEIEILVLLFPNKILRSNYLVGKISKIEKVSDPTVYLHLKILKEAGFVKKIEISARNVQYKLTSKGNDIAEEQILIFEERLERLINAVRNLPDPRHFVIKCIVSNICHELPIKWRSPKNEQKLEKMLTRELDLSEEQVLEIINLSPVS